MSDLARSVHFEALRAVDEVEHRQRPRPLNDGDGRRIYGGAAGSIIRRRMLEDLEPLHRMATYLLRFLPEPVHSDKILPAEYHRAVDDVAERWRSVAAELLE